MSKATNKQVAYAESLNSQLPEAEQIDRWDIIRAANDKFNGVKLTSAIIDQLKAKLGTESKPQVTSYTPAEDAQHSSPNRRYTGDSAAWYYTRNGGGRNELDNQ